MTAPVWRSAGTMVTSASDSTLSPGLPSGYQANDILVIVYNGFAIGSHTTPSGYTEVTSSPHTDTFGSYEGVCWKRATASESAPSIGGVQARIHAISGCITTGSPIDAVAVTDQTGSSTNSVSATGITTTAADDMVFVYICSGNSSRTVSSEACASLTSFAERTDDGAATGYSMAVATGGKTTAGATGTTTATISTGSAFPNTFVVGLKAGSGTTTVNGTDSATGTDTAAVQALAPGAESATGADVGTVTSPVSTTDGATGVDVGTVRVQAVDSGSSDDTTHVLAGGATLVFAGDAGSGVDTVGSVVIPNGDTFVAVDLLQTATVGINGPLPPGPRIVRVGQSTTTSG